MLPSPAELCERSRFYLEAARDAVDAATKRRFAACAFVLAQVAEAIERDKQGADANGAGLARVIADALAAVREAPSDEPQAGAIAAEEGPISKKRANIRAWRLRAEELRATAEQFAVPLARESLRRAAAHYDRRADIADASLEGRSPAAEEKKETG